MVPQSSESDGFLKHPYVTQPYYDPSPGCSGNTMWSKVPDAYCKSQPSYMYGTFTCAKLKFTSNEVSNITFVSAFLFVFVSWKRREQINSPCKLNLLNIPQLKLCKNGFF